MPSLSGGSACKRQFHRPNKLVRWWNECIWSLHLCLPPSRELLFHDETAFSSTEVQVFSGAELVLKVKICKESSSTLTKELLAFLQTATFSLEKYSMHVPISNRCSRIGSQGVIKHVLFFKFYRKRSRAPILMKYLNLKNFTLKFHDGFKKASRCCNAELDSTSVGPRLDWFVTSVHTIYCQKVYQRRVWSTWF